MDQSMTNIDTECLLKDASLPLVTFIMLFYKHEKYTRDAIKGALSQDYPNIEFIFSDDHSPDNTFKVMESEINSYGDNRTILLNRNDANLGLVPHLNGLLKIAKGEIIVLAAGDDISLPHRVSATVELFKDVDVSFVSFNDEQIDEQGNTISKGARVGYQGVKKFSLDDFISGKKIPFSGASRGFRRNIYDTLGDLNDDCPTEDAPYIIRGLMTGKTAISSDIAIKYRIHGENLSGPKYLPYMNIANISKQYQTDSMNALDSGTIDIRLHEQLNSWIRVNNIKRLRTNLRKKLSNNKFEFIFFFKHIMPAYCFSLREKAGMLKQCITQKI